MRAGKVLTMDERAVLADAARVSQRIWPQVRKASPISIPREPREPRVRAN